MKFFILLLFPFTILAKKKRPNIVFFFTDDHAPHAIGAYNGWLKSVNPTPEIDKLADDGMLFENSFCTNSICGPSRAVIMSGKHSHKNGFMNNGNSFNWNQQIFPKILRAAGYHTALYGKSHLKGKPQGFDSWAVLPGQGDYYNPAMLTPEGRKVVNGYCTDIVTDMAIDFIKESKELGKPFMLMCQHKAPHRTWMPALRHLHLYDDIKIPEPNTLFDQYEGRIPAQHQEMEIDRHMYLDHDLFTDLTPDLEVPKQRLPSQDRSAYMNMKRMTPEQLKTWRAAYGPKDKAFREAKLTGRDLVRWKFQRYAKNYLRAIKGVDENLARLRKALEDQGLADNTVFVYSSDQGFYIGDHGWYDKRWMYEESLKMPLIVSWPGVIKPGSRNTDLVQNLDYAQTFLDMAGAKTPNDMQGASLVPLLKGNKPDDWRKSIYYHYYEYPSYHQVPRHNGIRTDRYKLINFYEFGEWEFYDLKTDPDELKNLYGNSEKKELIEDIRKQLLELQKGYGDDTVLKEKPQEWKSKMRTTTSVKTKANFRPRVK
ncbi:MAG: sulfatase [Akkermansiaceae bacterium]|jgi:arylsulfatase A-like enzyme|nr:sulfatase [Akkermansiaceae bacterium]